jgi:hypothetical protein
MEAEIEGAMDATSYWGRGMQVEKVHAALRGRYGIGTEGGRSWHLGAF